MTDTAVRRPTIDHMPRRDAVVRVLFGIEPSAQVVQLREGRRLTDDECANVVHMIRREHEVAQIVGSRPVPPA